MAELFAGSPFVCFVRAILRALTKDQVPRRGLDVLTSLGRDVMRTIFHAAMLGGWIAAGSIGLVGCGSTNASQNKMSSEDTSDDRMGGNMMSNDKMSGERMAMDKMSGEKMNGKMAKDQAP